MAFLSYGAPSYNFGLTSLWTSNLSSIDAVISYSMDVHTIVITLSKPPAVKM